MSEVSCRTTGDHITHTHATFLLAIVQKFAARWEILGLHLKPHLSRFHSFMSAPACADQSKDQAQRSPILEYFGDTFNRNLASGCILLSRCHADCGSRGSFVYRRRTT